MRPSFAVWGAESRDAGATSAVALLFGSPMEPRYPWLGFDGRSRVAADRLIGLYRLCLHYICCALAS